MNNYKVSVTTSKNLTTKTVLFSDLKHGDRFFSFDNKNKVYVKRIMNEGFSSYHFAILETALGTYRPQMFFISEGHYVDAFYEPDQVKVGKLSIGEVFDFEGYPFMVTDNSSDKVEAIALDNSFIGRKHHFNGNMFVSICSYEFNKRDT